MLPSIANTLATAVTEIWHDEFADEKELLRAEIARLRQERKDAASKHAARIKETRQHVNLLAYKMETCRQEELPLHVYASALKEDTTTTLPSHLLLLQAQLCRAIHYMSVDSVQLQLQENLKQTLIQLAKHQQTSLLKELLFLVESRTELKQQQEDYEYYCQLQQEEHTEKKQSSEIDDLVNNLEQLQVNNNDLSPSASLDEWEQVVNEQESNSQDDIDFLLDDKEQEELFHKSLPTIQEGRLPLSAMEKKQRAASLIATGTWNSEKSKVTW